MPENNRSDKTRHPVFKRGETAKLPKSWARQLFRQRVLVVLLLLIQLSTLIFFIVYSSRASAIISVALTLLSLAVCLYIVNRHDKGAFKLAWVFNILLFPIAGGMLYLFFMFQSTTRSFGDRYAKIDSAARPLFDELGDGSKAALEAAPEYAPSMRYLKNRMGFPAYTRTKTQYLPTGEQMLPSLLQALECAEKYIFLEFFIIEEGKMWNPILEILQRKAAKGVIVRVLYDDMGCFFGLPNNYPKLMSDMGIECAVFNPFRPMLAARQNNRDHRKIASIDGKIAFTGGINLADEYINAIEKHGRWKDSAVRLEGDAAWSFTLIFLEMWKLCTDSGHGNASIKNRLIERRRSSPELKVDDFLEFKPEPPAESEESSAPLDGIVQPYADCPLDTEHVGEHVYVQIINNAKDYVYITSPYLILDDSIISALTLAAKSGVDVRIITPHIGDHKFVHMTTRSYYSELILGGVKIYEYTPGFIHAKTFVSDDRVGTVGTINLDYRSLYHHFECGAWLCGCKAVKELRDDFIATLAECQEITPENYHVGRATRFMQNLLRLFAPLM